MKLITFQTTEAFNVLQKNGILIADTSNIDLQKYGIPYDWMISEMKERGISPQNNERYPLWAWAKCGASIGPKRRKNTNHIIQDTVKITFEKPDHEVLLSDYMAYAFILSGHIVPKDKKEYTHFLTRMQQLDVAPEDLKNFVRHQAINPRIPVAEIKKSWSRIFDLRSYVHQACVWNIKTKEIKQVEVLKDPNYSYGVMNAKRSDGSRPDWKQKYLKFLK